MVDGNPNYYTRANIIELARIIDPNAWRNISPGFEPKYTQFSQVSESIKTAVSVLRAGYRNCTVK